MKMTKRNSLILLLLALLFAAPGLTAYLYYLHPQWLSARSTNKGQLLNPPVFLAKSGGGKAKWSLILWNPDNCATSCLQQLDKLARVRLALGRRLYEVENYLVLVEGSQQSPIALTHSLHEQDIRVLRLSKSASTHLSILNDKPQIFIANPQGYLVLTYTVTTQPGDIYHDLKQLLNTTVVK